MSPEFEYNMDGVGASTAGGMIGLIVGVYAVFVLLMMAFSVITYVLHSLGLYTISKRRGIHHSWLSWLPVGNMWILGSICDQYQYVAKGKVRNRRKVLLGIMIALYALCIIVWVGSLASVLSVAASDATAGEGVFGAFLVMGIGFVLMLVVAVVGAVFQYMAYYALYASCDPNNAVIYLLLSIFVNVTMPFLVFACRKKDLGMPPRRTTPAPVEVPADEPVAMPEDAPVAEEEDFAEPARFIPDEEV